MVRWQSLLLPVGLIACVLVMITPLPAGVLDVLLAGNLALAMIMLLTAVHVRHPLEFSVFPSLLLATTLSRLVLNVASTRLILTQAPTQQLDAAGHVIRAFGEFVTGNHTLVGLVIFAIIVVIQFVVITKGASRVSEVAARFALDGMPGRQMAIDADLNAGLIDEAEARRRRQELGEQADFYSAMDGASRFVRGDAIAGLVITAINIVGGLYVGLFEAHLGLAESGSLFTKLTVGDGLVSQTPALFISLAAALLVTRSSRSMDLPTEFLRQLFSRPQVLAVAAGFLGLLVFTRLPMFPLLTIGGGCAGLAYALSRSAGSAAKASAAATAAPAPPAKRLEDYLTVDPIEIEIGAALVRLADPNRGGDLLAEVTEVRRRVAAELGIVLPKVRIRDNLKLGRNQYRIKLSGNPVAEGFASPDRVLAVAGELPLDDLPGQPALDPESGRPARWIDAEQLAAARELGCRLQEPTQAIGVHLRQVVREYAADLLTRDATAHLIAELRKTTPAVVDELIPPLMKLGEVQQVLQRLLREEVPIRPLGAILEALADATERTRDVGERTEYVRRRLARNLCARYRDGQRRIRVVTVDPALQDRIAAGLTGDAEGWAVRLAPQTVQEINSWLARAVEEVTREGAAPVVLVSSEIRAALKQLTAARQPRLVVLSYDEITSDTVIESVRMVGEPLRAAA